MIAGIQAENIEVILYQPSLLVLVFSYCLHKSYKPVAPHYYEIPLLCLHYNRGNFKIFKSISWTSSFKNTASQFVEWGKFFNSF